MVESQRIPVGRVINDELAEWAALPSVIYPLQYDAFLQSPRRLCALAAVPLDSIEQVAAQLHEHQKVALLNIDTCPGFGRDEAVLKYLQRLGVAGVQSTRLAVLQKARALGMFTVQIVFFTDGSTVGKGIAATRSANPHLVQVMPFPVLAHIPDDERAKLGSHLAAGFVRTRDDVAEAIASGAYGVTATSTELWKLRRADLG